MKKILEDQNKVDISLFHISLRGGSTMFLHTQEGRNRQQEGACQPQATLWSGGSGLWSPYHFPQCLLTMGSSFHIFYPEAISCILSLQTCDLKRFRGPGTWTTGWSNKAVEKEELGPGWGTDASRNQTLRIFAYWATPLPKTSLRTTKNDSDRRLSNSVFIPLARLLDVPIRQAGEINFRFKWENQN